MCKIVVIYAKKVGGHRENGKRHASLNSQKRVLQIGTMARHSQRFTNQLLLKKDLGIRLSL
jgi:hypothetical protein